MAEAWTERDGEIRNAQRWTEAGVAKAAEAAEAAPAKKPSPAKKKDGAK